MAKITIETEGLFSPVIMTREAYDILKFCHHSEMERRRRLESSRDSLLKTLLSDIDFCKANGYSEYYSPTKLLPLVLKEFGMDEDDLEALRPHKEPKADKAEEPEDSEADEEDEDNG